MTNQKNNNLESIVKSKTGFKEYAKVFLAVEGTGYAGANAGIYITSAFTQSKALITTGVIVGDYIGASIGQLASFWYNNRERYRDENGKFQKLKMAKDFSKIILYDVPLAALTYAASSQLIYYMLEKDMDKAAVAGLSTLFVMTFWNTMNYFAYAIIKNESDEKLFFRLGRNIKSYINKFFGKSNHVS